MEVIQIAIGVSVALGVAFGATNRVTLNSLFSTVGFMLLGGWAVVQTAHGVAAVGFIYGTIHLVAVAATMISRIKPPEHDEHEDASV